MVSKKSEKTSTETSSDSKQRSSNKSDNVASRPSSSRSEFRKQEFIELKESMNAISEENELKRPLVLMADLFTMEFERIDERINDGFNQIHEQMDNINNQLSHILGVGKKDDIATVIEKQAKRWMEKKYRRSFEQSFMLKCEDSEIEEIDLYSAPHKKNECHIMAECTVALTSVGKILKCVRKRNELAKKQQVDENAIIVHIFALRIDQTKEKEINEEANEYGVILHITSKESI